MNIQIVSDIHLEFGDFELPDEESDILIAAGDIGVGLKGLEWLQTLGMPVIYVTGNHEFWGCEMETLQVTLDSISQGSNVCYLERKSTIMDGVRFLGCTLWTNLYDCGDEEMVETLQSAINDFKYISLDHSLITPDQLIAINHSSVEWLSRELAKEHAGPTVVITHHAPTEKSWVEDPNDYLRFAYCNRLESLLEENRIDLWVHGHIHHASDYLQHGTRVVCNPRGYKDCRMVKEFDASKLYKV